MGFISNGGGGGGGSLTSKNGAQVSISGTQSINNASATAVSWTTAVFDSGGYTNIGLHPTRLTCATTGLYLVTWWVEFTANGTGIREAYVYVNGVATRAGQTSYPNSGAGSAADFQGSMLFQRTAADYCELFVFQNSTGALTITTATSFAISYLGT